MYLFDTDTLSALTRGRYSEALSDKINSVPAERRFTSSINIAEMVYGAYRERHRTQDLLGRINRLIIPNFAVLPFDADAAWRYGELRAYLERRGTPIGDADTRIAAVALSRNLTVITGNVRHFGRVPGLAVENWLRP